MNVEVESQLQQTAGLAAQHADAVDVEGRIPYEAIAAMKRGLLLGVMIPKQFGGGGASLIDVASMCHKLGQSCGSSGLIFAMHQIEVAMLLPQKDKFSERFMRRITDEQLLLASVTSEEGVGGSVRTSICAVEAQENTNLFRVNKNATTISYGSHADGLLLTARKNQNAAAGDQVLVSLVKADYTLTKTSNWDTIGMRGTCSDGFKVEAVANLEQVCAVPFNQLAESIMLPVSHILWSSVWLGIATDACTRSRAYLREQMRRNPNGPPPPGNSRYVASINKLNVMKSRIKNAINAYQALKQEDSIPQVSTNFTADMNGLKISISEMALEVVNESLMICGIAGFKNNSPFSLGRHLRDIHSARLMISNDRIANNMAGFLVVQRSPVMEF